MKRAGSRVGFERLFVLLIVLGFAKPALMGQAQTGRWSIMAQTLPINPIHVALLYNGKILIAVGSGNCPPSLTLTCPPGPTYPSGAATLDPTTGISTFIPNIPTNWDMFCNGMVLLPDGRAFINGGTVHWDPFYGSKRASIFDPATNGFTDTPDMAHGRWYPTLTTLGDGRIMTFSGSDENGSTNRQVEIYTVGSGWSQTSTAPFTPDLYPRMHLLPNGKVFASGAPASSYLFDPATSTWTQNVATTKYGGTRTYGSSVLLPLTPANGYHPKIMILGGNNPATATTEIIDLLAATPKWQYGPSMSQPRIEMNAVILPNGNVLALGGSKNDEDTSTLSLNADLYNPATNTFSSAGANSFQRLYHSVALLLPDATVWVAGSNPSRGTYERHMEIYKPAYLFQSNGTLATRPSITSAPSSIGYGNPFTVQTPDAASISSAVLIKNGTVTHAFGMDQRMVGLAFTPGSGALTVTAPPNGNIAPPGYYMLFLLNSNGVPSVAKFVQLVSSGSSSSGVNFVQVNSTTQTSGSSLTVPYVSTQTGGNLNVVVVGWNDTSAAVSSVTDSKGNTYIQAVGPTPGTALTQSIYYAKNIASGSNTVTVTFNKAASYPDVRVLEYSGADPTNPLDTTTAAAGSGTNASSGSATTSSAKELIFGAGMTFDIFNNAGSGFTNRVITNFGDIAEDKAVLSTGSYSATAPLRSSAAWVMQMATFRASGQGSSNPPPVPTGISPTSGSVSGGTGVTITGTGFVSGATLNFGVTPASNVTVLSSTTMTATTPAHTAGTVDVVVTNSDGQSGTLAGGYTYSSTSGGAISFVQVNYKTIVGSGSSMTVAYPAAQTAGNLNVVVVGWNDTSAAVSSVTDSRVNTYTKAVGPTAGTALTQSIYYANNIAGGSNSVTITFTQAATYPDVRVLEYSGADPTGPLDMTAAAVGNSSTGSSGSALTTTANELIFGAGMTFDIYSAAGSGFTNRVITNFGDIAEDASVLSTGSYAATAPLRSSAPWVMQMATFKAKP